MEHKTKPDAKSATNETPLENGTGQKSTTGNETVAANPTNDNDTYIITNETDPNCTHKIQVFTAAVEDGAGAAMSSGSIDAADGNGPMVTKNNATMETVSPVKMEGNGSVSADTPSSEPANDPTE